MRYVLFSMAFGLLAFASGCTSDNRDYMSVFQPNYYSDMGGIPLYRFSTGRGYHGDLRLQAFQGMQKVR